MEQLLDYDGQVNGYLPDRSVFYRDGKVSTSLNRIDRFDKRSTGRKSNLPVSNVVDTSIVHPHLDNFYLNSP